MTSLKIVTTSLPWQSSVNDFEEFDRALRPPPPPRLIAFKHDPVACACASYRIWKETGSRWSDLDSVVPTQADIERAQQLKKYYAERLLMETLKQTGNTGRSEFRRKLGLLVVDELPITEKELGILHRLPYFYQEDLELDAMVAETNCDIQDSRLSPRQVENHTLIPVRRILKSRRAAEYYHYWFRDTTYNHPHALVVRTDNPLASLIDGLFERHELRVNAILFDKNFRGYHQSKRYYQLANARLAD